MQVEEFKKEVLRLLETEIAFDGHIAKIIENISEDRQKSVLEWIRQCKLGTIKPEPCKRDRSLLAFIYKSNDNRVRGILTKLKNSYFVELFLDKHKYYDQKRRYLGL